MKLSIIIILWLAILCFPFQSSHSQGARYKGSYTKSSIISHSNKKNLVIEGLEISSTNVQSCITLSNCENVIIKNCKFGPSLRTRAIYLLDCKNITIIDCTFENIQSGLTAIGSQGIKFEYNDVTNVVGKMHGAANFGNMVQFNRVSGAGNSISYNACENIPGKSSTEDIINLFSSHGTSQSPIIVKGNWIRGGGPSGSGGGILLGDASGSFQTAEENILVDPGQYGVAVAGGNNMILRSNKIYGKKQPFTNVAIYACNWHTKISKSHTITVEKNIVNFANKSGNTGNSWWIAENMEPVKGKETNKYDSNLSASVLPQKIIGIARSSSTSNDTPTPPAPVPDKNTNINDPSISIYIDNYNRICINNRAALEASASVNVKDKTGKIIREEAITGFRTILSGLSTGTYTIQARNGSRTHQKTIDIQ